VISSKTTPWSRRRVSIQDPDPGHVRHRPHKPTLDWPNVAPRYDVRLQCAGKKTYTDMATAQAVLRKMVERYGDSNIRIYACPHCGLLHVGHFNARPVVE